MSDTARPDPDDPETIPVLLLKTRSTPGDSYAELFSAASDRRSSLSFVPRFVPVLQHRFEDAGLSRLRRLLRERQIGTSVSCEFGGLIFTSQRAVEAFAKAVEEGRDEVDETTSHQDPGSNIGASSWPRLHDVPIYSVGPATTRALSAVTQRPPLQIFGEHTGNGEALAAFILDHYSSWYGSRPTKPSLLFLVGEQRRDIIPKTLMAPSLPTDRAIPVIEEVVYGTGVMESFPDDFDAILRQTHTRAARWIIVFSPTGCESMLRGLGILDEHTGKANAKGRDGKTFIATIGPTTRNYLVETFDFEPDVCAETPTPEGILEGIQKFSER